MTLRQFRRTIIRRRYLLQRNMLPSKNSFWNTFIVLILLNLLQQTKSAVFIEFHPLAINYSRNKATSSLDKSDCNSFLKYKIFPDDSTEESAINKSNSGAIEPRSKRSKIKPSMRKGRKRFLIPTDPKKSTPSIEEELAQHVQSVFSDDMFDIVSDDSLDHSPNADGIFVKDCGEALKKLERHPALVLNADYQPLRMLPLSVWSWQDTVKAVLGGKAVVVDVYANVVIRAVSLNMPVPSVIALREYAPLGKTKPAFTRRNVFLRDGYRCQYCSGLFRTAELSLDHLEPRCHGGKLTWENTVTSCRKCNGRKGCLRPNELHHVGMTLKRRPKCPSLFELANEANKFVPRRVHPTWAPFLGVELEEVSKICNDGSSLPHL